MVSDPDLTTPEGAAEFQAAPAQGPASIPDDAARLTGATLGAWCYANPNQAARTIELLRQARSPAETVITDTRVSPDNPHREYFPAYQLSYWRHTPGGTAYELACARDEAEVVRLEQHIPNDGTRTVTKVWLRHPANVELLAKLRAALETAFAAGQAAKAEELRKALGVAL